MANLGGQQQQDFQQRIERIAAQNKEDSGDETSQGARRTVHKARFKEQRKLPIASFVIAAGIGSATMLCGNVTAFQLSRVPPNARNFFETAGEAMGPFGIMGMLLFVAMIGLGLRDKPHVLGIIAGAVVMYLGEPYLANQMPDLWSTLYSPQHLENMLIRAGLLVPVISL